MAMGLKYVFSFKDEWERSHCVQILLEGYAGAVTELAKVSDPPVLLTKPSNGDKFQPIQGKEIALQLLSTTDMQFSEFFTATNRDYLIRYWIDNNATQLISNWNFAAWTGDNPDGWTVAGEVGADPEISEVGSTQGHGGAGVGSCNFYSTGAAINMKQDVLTSTYPYIAKADVTKNISGSLLMYVGLDYITLSAEDSYESGILICTGNTFVTIVRVAACDITIDSTVVRPLDLIFEGYMIPDMYYEPFLAPAYAVTLRATDGLGDLKNRLFESAADTPYTGQDDLLDIIEICLDQTGLALDIVSACNVFETTHNKADTDDPLPQTFINQEVYRQDYKTGWNCYDVLTDIMICLGAKLEQINGAWHIIQIRELAETSYDYRVYNSSGTYQSNSSKSPQLTVTSPTTAEATLCCWSGGEQMLYIIPAYKEFTLTQIYGYRENILQNGDFEREQWSDVNTPLFWSKSAAGTWIAQIGDEAEFTSDDPAAKNIYQSPANATIKAGERLLLKVKFSSIYADAIFNFMVKLDTGGAQNYMDDDGSWNAGVTYCNGTGGFIKGDILSDPITLDGGTLTVYIFEIDDSGLGALTGLWNMISIEVIPNPSDTYDEDNVLRTTNSTNYNFIPPDKEVNIGDLPSKDNAVVVYWGGLLTSAGVATTSWIHKGAADGDALLDHIVADIKNNHTLPTHKLAGTIHSKVMDFNTVLKESNLSNKIFIPGQMTYNPLRGTWTGEWLEIVTN